MSRELGDRRAQVNHLAFLGLAHFEMDRMGEALSYFEQAVSAARETGDRSEEGMWLAVSHLPGSSELSGKWRRNFRFQPRAS